VSDAEALAQLHRIIDQRIAQWAADHAPVDVRGIVTAVEADAFRCAARLDLADTPTPGIAVPAGMTPLVGDDVLVRRRADGFLLLVAILGRA
jgi:hypothetical protein